MFPFFLIYTIQTVVYLLRHFSNIQQNASFLPAYLKERILAGIFSSGVTISVFGTEVLYVGVIWFFPALFIGKTPLNASPFCAESAEDVSCRLRRAVAPLKVGFVYF